MLTLFQPYLIKEVQSCLFRVGLLIYVNLSYLDIVSLIRCLFAYLEQDTSAVPVFVQQSQYMISGLYKASHLMYLTGFTQIYII